MNETKDIPVEATTSAANDSNAPPKGVEAVREKVTKTVHAAVDLGAGYVNAGIGYVRLSVEHCARALDRAAKRLETYQERLKKPEAGPAA
jgi:predicted aldo/keto reductase-like oxidoreductase